MRRTTIYRSSRLAAVSCALGLAAAVAGAAAPSVAQISARPATVTVERGHTLWGLAQQYFGDPLLWPAIYRLNTDVIEDPHWIYPGEVLRLVEAEPSALPVAELAVADTVVQDTAAVMLPPAEVAPTIFARRRESLERAAHELRAIANPPYRPLRRGEYYSAGFLTDGDELPLGKVLGNVVPPAIQSLSRSSTTRPFEHLGVEPPSGAAYQVGDGLWIVRIGRRVSDHGRVVLPAGIARVVSVEPDRVVAQVSENFARITDGLRVLPLEPFPDPGEVRPLPVEDGITARVIAARDEHPLLSPQSVVFLDRGRNDGLALGDIFAIVRPIPGGESGVEQVMVYGMVVYLRDRTASLLALAVVHPDVRPGALARLVRKMPG